MKNFTEFGPAKNREEAKQLVKNAIELDATATGPATILFRDADGKNVGEVAGEVYAILVFTA